MAGLVAWLAPAAPGLLARIDYEYRRNGTANLFAFVDVHRPLAAHQSDRPSRLRWDHRREIASAEVVTRSPKKE